MTGFSQEPTDYLLWSADRKLTMNDFVIKNKQASGIPSFGQFSFDFQMKGLDFFSKSLNKNVRNYFMPAASWIDTSANVNKSLTYQQTLFDMSEIYARQFRKALKENRKQLVKGSKFVDGLNEHYISEFSKRRIAYDNATSYSTNTTMQKEWELQIQEEIASLKDYAYDK